MPSRLPGANVTWLASNGPSVEPPGTMPPAVTVTVPTVPVPRSCADTWFSAIGGVWVPSMTRKPLETIVPPA